MAYFKDVLTEMHRNKDIWGVTTHHVHLEIHNQITPFIHLQTISSKAGTYVTLSISLADW